MELVNNFLTLISSCSILFFMVSPPFPLIHGVELQTGNSGRSVFLGAANGDNTCSFGLLSTQLLFILMDEGCIVPVAIQIT